jgi:molybdenum cofactor guanylyltransferase
MKFPMNRRAIGAKVPMATIESENVLGLILAGGRSTRMEGREKSLIDMAQAPLIRHVADRLAPQVEELAVNANGDPARFAFLDVPVIADRIEGYAGPLAGIHAGLAWCAENRKNLSHVLSVAADTPFFPASLSVSLRKAAIAEDTIVLAASSGRRHPVFGLWPVALASDLGTFLSDPGNRKVMLFVQRHSYREIGFEPAQSGADTIDPFFNINTPEDLQRAASLWEKFFHAA